LSVTVILVIVVAATIIGFPLVLVLLVRREIERADTRITVELKEEGFE